MEKAVQTAGIDKDQSLAEKTIEKDKAERALRETIDLQPRRSARLVRVLVNVIVCRIPELIFANELLYEILLGQRFQRFQLFIAEFRL
jgi:hypothetical protein